MMLARLGVQIELLQNTRSNRIPPLASESILGVGFSSASRLPYAPIACVVWSSDMMNSTLGAYGLPGAVSQQWAGNDNDKEQA
jgi:hypothetical protein